MLAGDSIETCLRCRLYAGGIIYSNHRNHGSCGINGLLYKLLALHREKSMFFFFSFFYGAANTSHASLTG